VRRRMRVQHAMLIFVSILWSVMSIAQEAQVGNLVGSAKRGKALYQRYCIFCHGPSGDGRGESAPYLDPKPRDFTKAVFKCRSTPSGSLPLDTDLYETISRGIHASGMPAWKPLLKQERVDLASKLTRLGGVLERIRARTIAANRTISPEEALPVLNILGDIDDHGPRPAGTRDLKGRPDRGLELRRIGNQEDMLGDGTHDRGNGGFLEGIGTDRRGGDLT